MRGLILVKVLRPCIFLAPKGHSGVSLVSSPRFVERHALATLAGPRSLASPPSDLLRNAARRLPPSASAACRGQPSAPPVTTHRPAREARATPSTVAWNLVLPPPPAPASSPSTPRAPA